MSEAVAINDNPQDFVPQAVGNPNYLISLALEKQADPKTLEQLMDLQERWENGQARKFYVAAMTAFKQEAPSVLPKNDRVDFSTAKGRTAYNYANLGSIVQEITALLGKHSLSVSWATAQEGVDVIVTCHITHVAGHRESTTLKGPIDESGNKNRIQAVGSTVTYLSRYTLLCALGLSTGEDDDDSGGANKTKAPLKEPQKKQETTTATEGEKVTVMVEDVRRTSGTNKSTGKPWVKFVVKAEEKEYGTFSEGFAQIAKDSMQAAVKVEIIYTANKFGNDITAIQMLEPTERQPGEEG